jgi:flagellar basal-body rod modification protein FlgD
MAITATTAAVDTAAGAAAMKKATGMNKDDFLKLFIAQLQHQDPLNPMDGTEFIGQLAQLTQVEQAYNTNTNLQSLITAQNSNNTLSAVSFLGTTATAKGSEVELAAGRTPEILFKLSSKAADVSVDITDTAGNVVRTLSVGAGTQGLNSTTWDGLGNAGQPLSTGVYGFNVRAVTNGTKIDSVPLVKGKVDGVSLDGTTPVISMGGISVPITDIISVKGA